MASSLIKPYHVFISHYGKDTKITVASSIYHPLNRSGLNVFFDLEEFKGGQKLESTIKRAISSSSVGIVILSRYFAYSRWCLNELHWMQETDALIIPVFDHHVPPIELQKLRKGKGIYARAFDQYKQKKRYEANINKWKEALYNVNNYSGLELDSQKFNGDQGKLVDDMYRQVMQHLRRAWRKSSDRLFGIQEAFDNFKNFLDTNSEQSEKDKIVGIVGTAGSGITTLAEEFYYRRRDDFDRSSLLLGVRNASEQNGLLTLQSQLLYDLTTDCIAFRNISQGKDILADRVRRLCDKKSLKFLIVIDDVYFQDQLEALLRKEDVLRSGSLVVVTSHSEAVLKLSGISLIYKTKPLREKYAQELLCRLVFHKAEPIEGFEGLTQTSLSMCGRFPKFLRSLGKNLYLYGNNKKQDWENELQMMIPEILKAIWGDLDEEERQIFLDIVSFCRGKDKNSAIRVWNGSGWRGARVLRKLEYMCLVEDIDAATLISIPDCLCDLVQEIANRLWHRNVARSLLKEVKQAAPRIRGIREESDKLCERTTEELLKIELLHVSGHIPYAKLSEGLKNLVWLSWEDCSETPILPPEMNKLRVLELMKGRFQTLGQLPVGLKEISVECTKLVQITTIGSLKHLEKLTLDCIGLESLPPEFCELQALEHLVIKQCISLKSLADNFGKLTNLQYIEISYCTKLSSLPVSFGELTGLKTLEVSYCEDLMIREDIFNQICSIEELTMQYCNKLKIPSLKSLQGSLRKLNLFGTSIEQLPDINFSNLQQLRIGSPLSSSTSLPTSLNEASSLMRLEILYGAQPTSNRPSYEPQFVLDPSERQSDEASSSLIARYIRSSRPDATSLTGIEISNVKHAVGIGNEISNACEISKVKHAVGISREILN